MSWTSSFWKHSALSWKFLQKFLHRLFFSIFSKTPSGNSQEKFYRGFLLKITKLTKLFIKGLIHWFQRFSWKFFQWFFRIFFSKESLTSLLRNSFKNYSKIYFLAFLQIFFQKIFIGIPTEGSPVISDIHFKIP